jgi:hypothetical protein
MDEERSSTRRGKKLAPGLHWVGFRDRGYQKQALIGLGLLALVTAVRVLA